MFSKDGGFRTIYMETVVENTEKCVLTVQRQLRSWSKWNFGTAHIFWYVLDELFFFSFS